jgi:hypothetical protein
LTSEKPVTTPFAGSSVNPPRLLTLSNTRFFWPSSANVNRNIAAWSDGAISVFMPFSKVTP